MAVVPGVYVQGPPRRLPYYPLNVFEDMFNEVIYQSDTPEAYERAVERFNRFGPPTDFLPIHARLLGQFFGLPYDVVCIIARYIRPTYVEWLCRHVYFLLQCAETDHYRWILRQHRRLLPL